ncbi:hypothetical protein Tco_0862614, partial [Tanacetum coccineum]
DMADANINAPEVPADADSPPTRSDEQILPRNKWVPVGKSNCFLDVERSQANPIFKIAVDILKNTNFFNAFTASSTIPSIYIQQFWDTIRFDKDKGYSCQLDEQRFYLTKATLRDALQLPQDNNNLTSPPNANTIISFVNELGYPNVVRTLSGVVTNDMYQPWRALTTIINLCLTGKTSAFERPRAPVLQILWGVVNRANIDYAERIWEEFTQCIHSFTEDKMNLALHTEGKKKVNPLVIPGVRFTKLIINHLQSKHKFHKRPGSPLYLPTKESTLGYLKFSFKNTKRVTKYQRYLAGEVVSDDDAPAPKPAKGVTTKTTRKPKPQSSKTAPVAKPAASKTSKSTSSQPSKPTPAPAKPQEKKRKLVVDTTEAPPQAKLAKAGKMLKKRTLPSTRQLVDEFVDEGVPDKEPMYGDEEADTQKAIEESLKEVPGAHGGPLPPVVFREPDNGKFQPLPEVLGKGKEKVGEEQAAQVLLNLQTPKKKNPAEYETDYDNEVSHDINPKAHIEGQARLDRGKQVEAQARSDPGVAADSQLPSSHVVHAGPNLEHMNFEVTDTSSEVRLEEPASSTGTLSSLQNLDKELSFTDQFLVEKSREDEPKKTNTEAEVQSMRIGELELHMADLVDENQALEERLDKQGNMMYQLENLDIPRQASKAMEERIHLWETQDLPGMIREQMMEAPLRALLKDLPTSNMKEILLQRMLEENYDKGHEDHKMAYEALQTSILCDEREQFDTDKAEKLKKMKGKQDSPKTPPGSPPPPPPPPPPSGASGASGTTGASDSAQNPLLPPPHPTAHHDD